MSAARKSEKIIKPLSVERGARGRPTNFDERLRDIILGLIEDGKTDSQIANICSIDVATLHIWRSKYPDFFEAVKQCKSVADELVEVSLYRRATGYSHKETKVFCNAQGEVTKVEVDKVYPPDPTAMIFWLKNRQRDKWMDRQNVVIENPDDLLTDEQLRAKIAAMLLSRQAKERDVTDAAPQIEIQEGIQSEHKD